LFAVNEEIKEPQVQTLVTDTKIRLALPRKSRPTRTIETGLSQGMGSNKRQREDQLSSGSSFVQTPKTTRAKKQATIP